MKKDVPHILLINPWIDDFAAYDFWAKPMGILLLGAILRDHGFSVSYIDCLDRFHPQGKPSDPNARNGRGPYLKTHIPKPDGLEDVPRNFSRYGIKEEWFRQDLLSLPKPDMILVTSLMTYWYPGVHAGIKILKEIFPQSPIFLGGIYATLCEDHARHYSGADEVIPGIGEAELLHRIGNDTGFPVSLKFNPDILDTYSYPGFDLQHKINYVPIFTSRGCPFSCAYCASRFLNPKRMQRSPDSVIEEIQYWHRKYQVRNFIFYDDALLVDAEHHAMPLFEKIIQLDLDICFHTPNAVHIREISKQTAKLMFKANFKTLRLGLETTAFEKRNELDRKVTIDEFFQAASCLKQAGFTKEKMGAYLLAGLPGQSKDAIVDSIQMVKQHGITPVLAYYSPIPRTALWDKAAASSRYDLASDPIFTNNSIFPCSQEKFSWNQLSSLKKLI